MGRKMRLAGLTLAAVAGFAAARHYEIPQQLAAYRSIVGDARIEFCADAVGLHYDDYQGLRMLSARSAGGPDSRTLPDVFVVLLRYSVSNAFGMRQVRDAECLFAATDGPAAERPLQLTVGTQHYATREEIDTVVERVDYERFMSR